MCSPHRKGNTSNLVEAVLNGAKSQGAETEAFYLGDLKISPCNACNSCELTGRCIQDDDMRMIYNALSETNSLSGQHRAQSVTLVAMCMERVTAMIFLLTIWAF